MSKQIALFMSLLTVAFVFLAPQLWAENAEDVIVVDGAQYVRTESAVKSDALNNLATTVPAHMHVLYANRLRFVTPVAVPAPLKTLADLVPARVVTLYANRLRYVGLSALSSPFLEQLGKVTERVIVHYANHNRKVQPAFPLKMINDQTNPKISDVRATEVLTDTAVILWTVDEFANGELKYGTTPGSYSVTIQIPLYYKGHRVPLLGLQPSTDYYFMVRSRDRSGNETASDEYSFSTQAPVRSIFLPQVRR